MIHGIWIGSSLCSGAKSSVTSYRRKPPGETQRFTRRFGAGDRPLYATQKQSQNGIAEDHEDKFVWMFFFLMCFLRLRDASADNTASSDLTWRPALNPVESMDFPRNRMTRGYILRVTRSNFDELCTHPNPSKPIPLHLHEFSQGLGIASNAGIQWFCTAQPRTWWRKDHSFQAANVGVSTNMGRGAKPCVKQTN